jgi:heat shock protein HslJ
VRQRSLTRLALALAVILARAAAACGDDDDASATGQPTGPDDSAAPTGLGGPVADREFVSSAITEDGQPRPLVDGTQVTLQFRHLGLIARAGCNTLDGPIIVEPDHLIIGELATTEMACDPERQAQDEWLAGLLAADPDYTVDGDTLRIESGNTVIELTDREAADPDRPLEGTRWQLDGIVDGDAVSSVPAGGGATLVFADGRVSFEIEGCNQGGGDVTITDASIELGPLQTTLMGCAPPASDVEVAVTSVLAGDITYAVEAGTLTLTHPSGRGLVLRAAE